MTRDEAIAICKEIGNSKPWYESDVDQLVALGLLKLDEPKTIERIFIEAMREYGYGISASRELLDRIEGAGLDLVEKGK